MPYIKKEELKAKRDAIKKAFPRYKFSITRENYSGIRVNIMEGPIELTTRPDGNEQVNTYSIEEKIKEFPEKYKFINEIHKIANAGNGVLVEDGDYGTVPNFYVWIEIGKWDKPYVCKKPTQQVPIFQIVQPEDTTVVDFLNSKYRGVLTDTKENLQLAIELLNEFYTEQKLIRNEIEKVASKIAL